MAYPGVLFCSFMLVLAGNSVSGYSPSSGSEEKECVTTVEMVRTFLMKDSLQQVVISTLKKGCLGVYSKDKDVPDAQDFCEQEVKTAMSDLNNFLYTKMQSKDMCHVRNHTGNGVSAGEAQQNSVVGVICLTVVSFAEYVLENHREFLASATAGFCNYIPLPSFQSSCTELVIDFMVDLLKDIQKDLNPEAVCNANQFY
ncbi:Hypp652 [Branchiostoma lanceolatum]|uniref:Hypp652 protein n=1 Tax=Branchiostoma lanceolatum TaxID=7740 RepID=A0A8J9VFE4_BRALA|nr:Hypp652 [Branchiostoma lanceolatum]